MGLEQHGEYAITGSFFILIHIILWLFLSGPTVLLRPGRLFPLCESITHVPAGILHLPLACLWLQISLSALWTQCHTRLQCPSPRQSGNRRHRGKAGGRRTGRRKEIPPNLMKSYSSFLHRNLKSSSKRTVFGMPLHFLDNVLFVPQKCVHDMFVDLMNCYRLGVCSSL